MIYHRILYLIWLALLVQVLIKNPISTIQTAILGAINALQLAEKNKARVFQASTSEVYGDAQVHPQNEQYWGNVNPIGVRACYDEGKDVAKRFFLITIARKVDIRGVGSSIHMVQGYINDGRVVSNFIVQALQNSPITVYGKGLKQDRFAMLMIL